MASATTKTSEKNEEISPAEGAESTFPTEMTSTYPMATALHHRGQNILTDEINGVSNPGGGYYPTQASIPTQYHRSPAQEYADSVRQWLWQRQWAMQMSWYMYVTWPTFVMNCTAAANVASMMSNVQVPPGTAGSQVLQPQARARQTSPGRGLTQEAVLPQQNGIPSLQRANHEYVIPSVWRRVAAEFIDFFLLFTMKLGVSLFALDYIGMVDVDKYDLENLLTRDWDSNAAMAITSELLAMEIINRIFVCIFETLCLWRGLRGATPGKRFMKLRVVSCQQLCINIPNGKVLVSPAGNIGFWNALLRSTIKNFSMAFLFPVCCSVFFLPNKRAAYDVIAGSIVVEDDIIDWPRQR